MCNEYGGGKKTSLGSDKPARKFYFFSKILDKGLVKQRREEITPLLPYSSVHTACTQDLGGQVWGPVLHSLLQTQGMGCLALGTLALRRAILFWVGHEAFLGARYAVSWEGVSDTRLQFSLPALVNKPSI